MAINSSHDVASYAPAQVQQPISRVQQYLVLKDIQENPNTDFRYILEYIGLNLHHLNFVLDYFKRESILYENPAGTPHRFTGQGKSLYDILQSHFKPDEHEEPVMHGLQSGMPKIDPERIYTFGDVTTVLNMTVEEVRKATESGALETTPVYAGNLNMQARYPGTSLISYLEQSEGHPQTKFYGGKLEDTKPLDSIVQEETAASPKKPTDRQTQSVSVDKSEVKLPDNDVLALTTSWPVDLKACPKCGGDMYYRADEYGPYKGCLPCGYTDNEVARIFKSDGSGFIGSPTMDLTQDPENMPTLDEYVAIMGVMKDKKRATTINQLEIETGIHGETIMRHLNVLINIGYVTINGKSTNKKRSERYSLRSEGINFVEEYESKTDELEQLARLRGLESPLQIRLVEEGELTDAARNLSDISMVISDCFDGIIRASSGLVENLK